jgi:hypothetical protein
MDLINLGSKYRCFSYAYTCKGAFYYNKRMNQALKTSVDNNIGVMMDSAAHSIHHLKAQGLKKNKGKFNIHDIDKLRDLVMDQYVEYVNKEGKHWDFHINFDYIKNCPEIYRVQKVLEEKGLRPVPVYHGDHGLEWLKRYCKEGYKLISIGTVIPFGTYREKRRYYDNVFNISEKYGVLLHGLAMTGLSLMFQYPWYSVDSATWAKTAAYGSMLHVDMNRQIIGEIHITDQRVNGKTCWNQLPKDLQRDIRHTVEDNGFDFHEMQTDGRARSLYNVWLFCNKLHELKDAVKSTTVKWKNLL